MVFPLLRDHLVPLVFGNSSVLGSSLVLRQEFDHGQMDSTSDQEDVRRGEPKSEGIL